MQVERSLETVILYLRKNNSPFVLENGKTAQVSILAEGEIGFGLY